MIKIVAIVGGVLLIGLILLTQYLSVDNLRSCDVSPDGTAPCVTADAIVAVSGGNTSARTKEAIDLYKAGWADTLIFSGAAFDAASPSNASVMRQQALENGVPESDILVEEYARTTKQNAENTRDLLTVNDIQRVILVTSGYHQRRANLEFRALAGENIEIVNHPTKYDDDWGHWWWLTPRGWWLAGGEVVKIIAFYLGGSA